jgi:hypothetical protein
VAEGLDGDKPPKPYLDLPGIDSEEGRSALAQARRALSRRHTTAMHFDGASGKHSDCETRQHHGRPCSCCPMCEEIAHAMLEVRRGRTAFKSMDWPDFYAFIGEKGPQQSAVQWVEEGEDRLAPKYELPANPRTAILGERRSGELHQGNKRLDALLDLWSDPERAEITKYVLAEAAVLCRRREFDGDNYTPFPWNRVGTRAIAALRKDIGWDGPNLTAAEARGAVQDMAGALREAPESFAKVVGWLGPRLDRWVFSRLGHDDSLDRIHESAGHELIAVDAFTGQDPDSRTRGVLGELQESAVRAVLRSTRAVDIGGLSPVQRQELLRDRVVAHLSAEVRQRGGLLADELQAWPTALFGPVAEGAVDELRAVLASEGAEAEIEDAPPSTSQSRAQVRFRHYGDWGLTLKMDEEAD